MCAAEPLAMSGPAQSVSGKISPEELVRATSVIRYLSLLLVPITPQQQERPQTVNVQQQSGSNSASTSTGKFSNKIKYQLLQFCALVTDVSLM